MRTLVPTDPVLFDDFKARRTRGQRARRLARYRALTLGAFATRAGNRLRQLRRLLSRG
jgi:hypothetical protein